MWWHLRLWNLPWRLSAMITCHCQTIGHQLSWWLTTVQDSCHKIFLTWLWPIPWQIKVNSTLHFFFLVEDQSIRWKIPNISAMRALFIKLQTLIWIREIYFENFKIIHLKMLHYLYTRVCSLWELIWIFGTCVPHLNFYYKNMLNMTFSFWSHL